MTAVAFAVNYFDIRREQKDVRPMKRYAPLHVAVVVVFVSLAIQPGWTRSEEPVATKVAVSPPNENPVDPLNKPDSYAWQLFAYVNAPAPEQVKLKSGGAEVTTNSALWQIWASNEDTFPDQPTLAKKPTWPGGGAATRRVILHPRALASPENRTVRGAHPQIGINPKDASEERHRNKSAFDFIVNNNLWYTEGLAAAFAKGKPLSFPSDSIEIKANWVKITPEQKARFHWDYDTNGELYGLVAMHISSKVLPNWFWATFEWVDNPGRSDYIGSRDQFGIAYPLTDNPTLPNPDPTLQQPYSDRTGKIYPPGKVTDALLALFKDVGFDEEWTAQWLNYRLKGSQVDFSDSAGVPTLLGNSVTEAGFVATSSCITCHARATINSKGALPLAPGFKPVLIPVLSGQASLPLFVPAPVPSQSYNGNPDPAWFWQIIDAQPSLRNQQVDFVWSFRHARPLASAPK